MPWASSIPIGCKDSSPPVQHSQGARTAFLRELAGPTMMGHRISEEELTIQRFGVWYASNTALDARNRSPVIGTGDRLGGVISRTKCQVPHRPGAKSNYSVDVWTEPPIYDLPLRL